MLPAWRTVTLLLLLLGAAGGGAQSGDGDLDTEVKLSCSSDISTRGSSVTCQLLGGDEDDEDGDGGGGAIANMTLCQTGWKVDRREEICQQADGNTLASEELCLVSAANVTVQRRGGGRLSAVVNLQKIVKPRSPRVWNVSSEPQQNRTVVYIQIPYTKDFLTLDNQIFQFQLWTAGSNMTQNISSRDFLLIDMQHLRRDSEYRVKVRALPQGHLQGTWSDWSEVYTFTTPPAEAPPRSPDEWSVGVYGLVLSSVSGVVVLSSIVIFWKNKIFSCMWPSIPHPKQTLVQICKPNKGLLLHLSPEVFSSLKVYPLEKTHAEEAEPSLGPAAAAAGSQSGSTQSSNCRSATSVSTEELEISALLSRGSSDGEDSAPSGVPFPVGTLQRDVEAQNLQPERAGPRKEEAYVTMSSFYQTQ